MSQFTFSPKIIVTRTCRGMSITITVGEEIVRKASFPDSSLSSCDTIYKSFPQVSFLLRIRSFENTQHFLTTKVSGSAFFFFWKPLPCWQNLGLIEIKFIGPKQKTVSGAQTTVINSHLLMPHVIAAVVLLIHFFHQSYNTVFYSSASRHWMLNNFSHWASVLETVMHVLLTLFCSLSSGMQRAMEHRIRVNKLPWFL